MPNSVLYLLTIFMWGSSWFVIKLQLGVVSPEVSIFYRMFIAAVILLAWCLLRGVNLRYGIRGHLRFAFIGLFLFNLNYVALYFASFHLTTGLVSVLFSSVQIVNMIVARLVLGDRITARMVLGAVVGIAGITLVFSPEIRLLEWSQESLRSIGFAMIGTLSASIGMISSARFQRESYPVMQTNAWGMGWGAVWLLFYILVTDLPLNFEFSTGYVGGLLWLSVFSTVFGFGCFLTLVGRIGAGRASYAMVVFPLVALFISTLFEDYQWSAIATTGLALTIAGNIIILLDRQSTAISRNPMS